MSSPNIYDVDDVVTASGTFDDEVTGAAVDPTTVYCKVIPPGGTQVTYIYGINAEVIKDSVGRYHVDIDATIPGTWKYKWTSTGSRQGSTDDIPFIVRRTVFS